VKVLGWIMVAFGLVGLAVKVQGLVDGTGKDVVVGLVLSAVFVLGGLAVVRARARRIETPHPAAGGRRIQKGEIDADIFRLAEDRGGRVTPVEVAASIGVPFDVAADSLEALSVKGACQILVTEAGVTVYRFPEFEGLAAGKRDLLE